MTKTKQKETKQNKRKKTKTKTKTKQNVQKIANAYLMSHRSRPIASITGQ